MTELRWGVVTDPGRIRQQNEDSVLVDSTMFAVADGMGGHKAGEVASALTVQLLKRRLEPSGSLDDVLAAVVEANHEIFQAATSNVDHQGMGTTLTGLFVVRPPATPSDEAAGATPAGDAETPAESFALINVGDSRTYLLRHGRLRRITVDHNYVQELVNSGHISDEEARTHPRRNIITRALGIDPSVRVDAWTLPIVRGDRFVVASDGLSDEVHDNEIHQILTTVAEAQAAAEELVAAANRQGGRDNVSVIVVDVLDGVDPPAPDEELDIEPVWQPAPVAGTWAVADPSSAEPEAFEDLAALASAQGVRMITPAGGTRVITAEVPVIAGAPKKRRRAAGFLLSVLILAILVTAFVITAAYARRGYHVAFDEDGRVVIYQGRNFLWFEPTVEGRHLYDREQIDENSIERIERGPEFANRGEVDRFLDEQVSPTTSTTTTTTTTTTSTTSTTTTTEPRSTTTRPSASPTRTTASG